MEDKRIRLLRDEPINKAVNNMSIPAIIGLLVMAIYNVVDTMFVAWLGTNATGATQVVFPISMLVSAIGLAFGMGGGSYISRLLGSNKKSEANKVASVSFISTICLGILFTIFSISFIKPILGFFGAENEVMELSKIYGFYILIGSTFVMGNMSMNNMLRSEGSAKLSMIGMGIGAVLNIILDPIFIFVFDLGIAGAAMATTISQMVTFAILASKYLSNHSVVKIALKYFKPSKLIYKEILKVGVPTFFRQVLLSISIGILNNSAVNYGGPDLLAAIGLVLKTSMLPMYIVFGIGQGFQPVAGYNYGANNKSRVMDSFKYSMTLCVLVSLICSIILIIFSSQILSLFRVSESVLRYGVVGMKYNAIALVFMSITNTVGVFYQALGKGKESLLLSVSRQGVFFIPAIIILPNIFGVTGILTAQLVADILTLILSAFMFVPFIMKDNLGVELVSDEELAYDME